MCPLFQFLDDLLHIDRLQTSVHFLADHHHRSESAGSYAAEAVEGIFTVGGGFAYLDAEHALELFEQFLRAAHIAGSSHTDGDGVLAFRCHGEEGVECDHAVHF